ncbi:MAG: hypothetical protein IPQ16_11010 [Geobacteraceae bacterium]|nr:hypothetical protein [Geobacteraceae bacterium]
MIKEFATCLAEQMGIQLTRISVVDGKLLGCRDSHLLQLYADGQMESTLLYQRELEALQNGSACDRLGARIRSALSRLQMQQET